MKLVRSLYERVMSVFYENRKSRLLILGPWLGIAETSKETSNCLFSFEVSETLCIVLADRGLRWRYSGQKTRQMAWALG